MLPRVLKMPRIKKFGASNKFKGNKQLSVNKYGVIEKRKPQPQDVHQRKKLRLSLANL